MRIDWTDLHKTLTAVKELVSSMTARNLQQWSALSRTGSLEDTVAVGITVSIMSIMTLNLIQMKMTVDKCPI